MNLRSVPMSGRELGDPGDRVRIVRWATQNGNGKETAVDDNKTVPPGTTGTITGIQYDGTRYAKWDNGSTLNLLHDHDEWEVIQDEDDPCCLLYKNLYPQDHEYDCPKAVNHRKDKP